jgi:hypothetical protein
MAQTALKIMQAQSLPLVKRFRFHAHVIGFTPKLLNSLTLRYFSALTNLQDLGIDNLQVFAFMPIIQQCFEHLSPNLQFLALKEPKDTCRQVLYFIGLFLNLQDLKLHCCRSIGEPKAPADATLISLSTPPLRGWLRLVCFKEDEIVKDMVTLFGGLWFCYLDLAEVSCAQLLLYECAGTLETLRLYPTSDSHGKNSIGSRRG